MYILKLAPVRQKHVYILEIKGTLDAKINQKK